MTIKEIVPEVVRLPLKERLIILDALVRSVREELFAESEVQTIIPFEALRGALKPNGETPSDEELRDDYTSYLVRKYA